jgi:hypothetical protein
LFLDPFLYAAYAPLHFLKLGLVIERVRFAVAAYNQGVTHLDAAADVAVLVEAEKHLPGHGALQ